MKSTLAASLFESPKKQDDRTKTAIYVALGKDRLNEMFGGAQPNLLKVSGKDTNGDLCIFEGYSTQKGGPPLHIHHEQDEWFQVLEGEFMFQVGKEKFRLKAGDCILAPRGIPHSFAKVSDGQSKMTTLFQPAGQMEAFFRELGKVKSRSSKEEFQKLFQAHGMEIIGPPLPIEAEKK